MPSVAATEAVPTPRDALVAPSASEVVALETTIERVLKREHPLVFWTTLLIPLLGWTALVALLTLSRGKEFALKILALTIVIEAVAGRFIILGGAHGEQAAAATVLLTRIELFWLVAWIDFTVSILFLYHASFIYRIWKIGPWLESIRDTSRAIVAKSPWLGRFSFLGVVLYVGIPFLGSGAIFGSMLGQLLGLSRFASLLAVLIGTLLGNAFMLVLAEVIMQVPFLRQQHPLVLLGVVVGIGLVVIVLQWRYARRRATPAAPSAPAPADLPSDPASATGPAKGNPSPGNPQT